MKHSGSTLNARKTLSAQLYSPSPAFRQLCLDWLDAEADTLRWTRVLAREFFAETLYIIIVIEGQLTL